MSFSSWRLDALIERVRQEFSVKDNPENNGFIRLKLNEAMHYIARQKRGWRWSLKTYFIDVADSVSASMQFTRGSRVASVAAAGGVSARSFLVASTGQVGTRGYLVVADGTDADSDGFFDCTLESQYRGSTGTVNGSVMSGLFQLPEDFTGMETVHDLTTVEGETFRPLSNSDFAHIQNQQQLAVGTEHVYTVVPDPLNEVKNWYLAVFPYIGSLTTLRLQYYRVPPILIENDDIPILPQTYAPAMLQLCYWFYSVAKGYNDRVAVYRATALEDIKNLIELDEYMDEVEPSMKTNLTLDLSAIRNINEPGVQDYNPGMI